MEEKKFITFQLMIKDVNNEKTYFQKENLALAYYESQGLTGRQLRESICDIFQDTTKEKMTVTLKQLQGVSNDGTPVIEVFPRFTCIDLAGKKYDYLYMQQKKLIHIEDEDYLFLPSGQAPLVYVEVEYLHKGY